MNPDMKHPLLCTFLFIISLFQFAEAQTYYQVLDAAEANKLFNALKTDSSNLEGWPLPAGPVGSSDLVLDRQKDLTRVSRVEQQDGSVLFSYKIARLILGNKNLAGVIPAIKLDSLKILRLYGNQITGIDAAIQLPSIDYLDLNENKIESWPNLPFPSLRSLGMEENGMKGPIPFLNFGNLEYLHIDENELTGSLNIHAPKLYSLWVDDNKLSGSLKNINCPNLSSLKIDENSFEGTVEIAHLPELTSLDISENQFVDFGDNFLSNIPKIHHLDCSVNRFQFDDLIPIINAGISNLEYGPQQYLPVKIEKRVDIQRLIAEVEGTGNLYQWYMVPSESPLRPLPKDSLLLFLRWFLYQDAATSIGLQPVGNASILEIAIEENPLFYACLVKNPQVPDVVIPVLTLDAEASNCWENEYFSFCIIDDKASWGPGDGKNEIKTTKPLSINEILNFEGTITVDTAALKISLDGQIFVQDIPLPGGGVGNFTLANGAYELSLLGKDGKITGFLNDKLSQYTPNIGGLDLKLEDLQLVGGKNAQGISMNLQISWDNLTPSCGTSKDQTTAIKLQGLQITRDGISVEGMEVGDLGLAPGFCLKELKASYDSEKDKLDFALSVLTPFIEVGGGIGFVGGELDNVAMKAVLQNAIIPIGATGVGIIGCEGRINSIAKPPMNIRFGGIFSAVASRNLFQLTTSMEYIPPSELKVELGDGKFFNPPYTDDWWLGEGGVYGQLDFKTYRLKLGGELKLSPYNDDQGNKQHMVAAKVDMGYRSNKDGGVFVGRLEGNVTIPELSKDWPYDWLNEKLGLPHQVQGSSVLLYKKRAKYVTGTVNFGGRIGNVRYDMDLSKRYDEEGFFNFEAREISLAGFTRSDQELVIPENTSLAVVRVMGHTSQSVTYLTNPNGKVISINNPGQHAEWNENLEEQKGFWTLYEPYAGTWTISSTQTDSINWFLFGTPQDFVLNVQQEANGLHITWDPSIYNEDDYIDLFIDDNNTGLDGIWIMETSARSGEQFIENIQLPDFCSFYVFGIASSGNKILSTYAEKKIDNISNTFTSPVNLEWSYDKGLKELILEWDAPDEDMLAGYVINRNTKAGEQTIAMLYADETSFSTIIDSFLPDQIVLYSYGLQGESSCPVHLESSVAAEEPEDINNNSALAIHLFPNPARQQCTVSFISQNEKTVRLEVFDIMGKMVKRIPAIKTNAGVNHYSLNLNDLVNGQYVIRMVGQAVWVPGILVKI